jgi:hypothetical protein
MPRSGHSSRRLGARGAGTPQMSGPSDMSAAASAPSLRHLVNGHDDKKLGIGVRLHDHDPRVLQMADVDHKSALHDVRVKPCSLLKHSADFDSVTPRCSMRNSAWPVNESSQLHHSGKVGIELLGGSIVAPAVGHKCWRPRPPIASRLLAQNTQPGERPVLKQRFKEEGTRRVTVPRARCSPLDASATRILPGRRKRIARGKRERQLQAVAQVTGSLRRAALCAARLLVPMPVRSPTAIPWRERPPEMAAWPAKPAATDVVAHATLKDVGAYVGGGRSAAGIASVTPLRAVLLLWSGPDRQLVEGVDASHPKCRFAKARPESDFK